MSTQQEGRARPGAESDTGVPGPQEVLERALAGAGADARAEFAEGVEIAQELAWACPACFGEMHTWMQQQLAAHNPAFPNMAMLSGGSTMHLAWRQHRARGHGPWSDQHDRAAHPDEWALFAKVDDVFERFDAASAVCLRYAEYVRGGEELDVPERVRIAAALRVAFDVLEAVWALESAEGGVQSTKRAGVLDVLRVDAGAVRRVEDAAGLPVGVLGQLGNVSVPDAVRGAQAALQG